MNNPKNIHTHLKAEFPHLFNKPYVPLQIGIKDELVAQTGIDPINISRYLFGITSHPLYLANFLDRDIVSRKCADGSCGLDILESDRQFAKVRLARVLRKKFLYYSSQLGSHVVLSLKDKVKDFT